MHKTYDLLQQPSLAEVWRTIKNPGKIFGGTVVAMSGLLKLTHTFKGKKYCRNGWV